jgi:hypothetical protein
MSDPIIKTFWGEIPNIDYSVNTYTTLIFVKVDITENGNIYIYEKRDSQSNMVCQYGTFCRYYSIEDNKKIPNEYFKIFEQVISSRISCIGHLKNFCNELKKLINEQETNIKLLKEQNKRQYGIDQLLINQQQKQIILLQYKIKNYEKIKLEMTSNQPYLSKYHNTDNAKYYRKKYYKNNKSNKLNNLRKKYLIADELE